MNNINIFNRSKFEAIDREQLVQSMFRKLVKHGFYDFNSKRSKQVILRFKVKLNA